MIRGKDGVKTMFLLQFQILDIIIEKMYLYIWAA